MSADPIAPTPRDASPPPAGTNGQGTPRGGGVYLLHFDQRYEHAGHYTGHADDFDQRLPEQFDGGSRAARLIQVITQAGIGFRLARTWPGASKARERQLKNSGGASRYCPICQDQRKAHGQSRRPRRRAADRSAATPGTPARLHPQPPASTAVPTRGVRPSQVREFLRLNPKFARPVRASLAKQWGRVRGREEIEALGPRVTGARFDENQPLFQQRVRTVTRRAAHARAQARQQQLAERAEQTRTRAVAARTYQRLSTTSQAPARRQRAGRGEPTSSRREGGHER